MIEVNTIHPNLPEENREFTFTAGHGAHIRLASGFFSVGVLPGTPGMHRVGRYLGRHALLRDIPCGLIAPDGTVCRAGRTDFQGFLWIKDLPAGEYRVRFVDQVADALDIDVLEALCRGAQDAAAREQLEQVAAGHRLPFLREKASQVLRQLQMPFKRLPVAAVAAPQEWHFHADRPHWKCDAVIVLSSPEGEAPEASPVRLRCERRGEHAELKVTLRDCPPDVKLLRFTINDLQYHPIATGFIGLYRLGTGDAQIAYGHCTIPAVFPQMAGSQTPGFYPPILQPARVRVEDLAALQGSLALNHPRGRESLQAAIQELEALLAHQADLPAEPS